MDGCMHGCMHGCLHGCMHVYMYVCMCVNGWMYVCIYVCMYMYAWMELCMYACMHVPCLQATCSLCLCMAIDAPPYGFVRFCGNLAASHESVTVCHMYKYTNVYNTQMHAYTSVPLHKCTYTPWCMHMHMHMHMHISLAHI